MEASSRLLAVSSAATMNPSSSTPMCSFRQSRRFFDALCLCAFHSPQPRIFRPVESTIRWIGPSWARVRGGTATIWFRRESVVWSGALRSRSIKMSSESRKPSVWRSGRLKTTRSVNAVKIARFEYRRWPSRRLFFAGIHGGDRLLAQPDRDVAAAPEATFVFPPVPDSVLRLVLAVDSARLPCGHNVAPLDLHDGSGHPRQC